MSQCVVYTQGGAVLVLRLNQAAVAALQIPTWADARAALAPLGGSEIDWLRYRQTMTAFTETEAVRAMQDCWVPGGVHYAERRRTELLVSGLTRAEAEAQIASEAAAVSNVTIQNEVGLLGLTDPVLRRFRASWRQSGATTPFVDMPRARLQRMGEVRQGRTVKLLKSDADLLRAQEAGNTMLQTSLKDYRQKLRDLPATEQPNVDAVTTPGALAAWGPTWPVDPA